MPRVLIQEVSLWKNSICDNVNVDDAVTAWRLISLAVVVGFTRQDTSEDAEPTNSISQGWRPANVTIFQTARILHLHLCPQPAISLSLGLSLFLSGLFLSS